MHCLCNGAPTTERYSLSLHDALPISYGSSRRWRRKATAWSRASSTPSCPARTERSEEHTSELQSESNLVFRLLLEKKNGKNSPRSWSRGGIGLVLQTTSTTRVTSWRR